MSDALTMDEVAAKLGYSWERFRKVWQSLPGFPAPFKRPLRNGRGTYAWRAEAIEAWRLGRERAFGDGGAHIPEPANDAHHPRAAHRSAVQRQRAALGRMMHRG